jgi:hypothetical protein
MCRTPYRQSVTLQGLHIRVDGEATCVSGLKGHDITSPGQRPGNMAQKIVEPCKSVTYMGDDSEPNAGEYRIL